jgi:hypothetical protein
MNDSSPKVCYFCNIPLADQRYVWVCKNCGTAWCDKHKKTNFKWDWLNGLEKEHCPNCRILLKENFDLIPDFSAPSAPTASKEPINQPVNETVSHTKPIEGGRIEEPKKLTSTSFVLSLIQLVFFGALTIYGVVGLFVLWDLGFSWILFSIGCIVFGGRVSYDAIQEIVKYIQQKNKE